MTVPWPAKEYKLADKKIAKPAVSQAVRRGKALVKRPDIRSRGILRAFYPQCQLLGMARPQATGSGPEWLRVAQTICHP